MKFRLALLLFVAILLPLHADLFISEYIEGSSNNKAVEIYNPGPGAVDLSNYAVRTSTNGGSMWNYSCYPTGTLAVGDVYVIANASAATAILDVADVTSTITYFNGDDAVYLFVTTDGGTSYTAIDVIGVQGVDPGTAWAVAGTANATAEHTLVRKPTVTTGTTDWTASAGTTADDSQWLVYAQNDFSYIGSHTMVSGSDPVLTVTSPNGGEDWEQGSTENITWSCLNNTDEVNIYLVNTATSAETLIGDETDNDGVFEWAIGTTAIGSSYIILIESTTIDTLEDESDATFSIIAPLPVINSVTRDIYVPTVIQALTVTANVTGGATPYDINLKYVLNFGAEQTVAMTGIGSDNYTAVIPAQSGGTAVTYWVEVTNATRADVSSSDYNLLWGLTPMEKARDYDPTTGALTYVNYPCRVEGIALNDDGTYATTYTSVSLDANWASDYMGGINLYYNGTMSGIVRGHDYIVTGVLLQYNGLAEIQPNDNTTDIIDNGIEIMPSAQIISYSTFSSSPELYESRLVAFENVNLVSGTWPAAGSSATLTVTDDGGSTTFALRIDNDTDIDGNPEPAWPVMLTGIISQYDSSSPYTSGYQLMPRSINDFAPMPDASYQASVDSGSPGLINFDSSSTGVMVNFTDVFTGGLLTVMLTFEVPGNTNGISENIVSHYFWDFSALDLYLGTNGATIYIDLDDLPNNGGVIPGNEELVTFYTRSSAIDDFEVIPYVYNAAENRYEITVSHFCQFAIASEINPLPVELSSFTAQITTSNTVMLQWVTQSETDMVGYHVLRSDANDLTGATFITDGIITSHNNPDPTTYTFEDAEVSENETWYYWLEGIDNIGHTDYFGPVMATVVPDDPYVPKYYDTTVLGANVPNPFNPDTQINFELRGTEGESVFTELAVYNVRGQLVKTLYSGSMEPGQHSITWNGTDDSGRPVSSGVYFYRLSAPNFSQLRKMMLLK